MKKTAREMSRTAIKQIDEIVIALCGDYSRRDAAIREMSVPRRVRMEYVYINTRLLVAASEICGFASAERLIEEIGGRVGYAKSELESISETSYKALKSRAKRRIAKALYLE